MTLDIVADYSQGYPTPEELQKAGFHAVIRYVGFEGRLKSLTSAEYQRIIAAGMGVGAVFQDGRQDWKGGYAAGKTNGNRARFHATLQGFPINRPIYMAIDQDIVTPDDFRIMLEYIRGAASSLGGPDMTGVYGEYDVIDAVYKMGYAMWYWQTVAWSHHKLHPRRHLYQYAAIRYAGTIACDVNEANVPNWGQATGDSDVALKDEMLAFWDEKTKSYSILRPAAQVIADTSNRVEGLERELAEVKALLTSLVGGGVKLTPSGQITVQATP